MSNYEVNMSVKMVVEGNNPADAEEFAIEEVLDGYVERENITVEEVKELV